MRKVAYWIASLPLLLPAMPALGLGLAGSVDPVCLDLEMRLQAHQRLPIPGIKDFHNHVLTVGASPERVKADIWFNLYRRCLAKQLLATRVPAAPVRKDPCSESNPLDPLNH